MRRAVRMSVGGFDEAIFMWVQANLHTPLLDRLMVLISTIGNAGMLWICISVLMLFWRQTRRAGVLALISISVCWIASDLILKPLVARPRPFDAIAGVVPLVELPTSFSFPSGHSCSSFAVSCIYLRCFGKKALPFLALAALMMFSRVYVGVHYPTDVCCGMLLGIFGSQVVWYVAERRRTGARPIQ